MKVITVTSEKGGTGKTTLATHIAAGLALRGKRVLLVDFDPQGHATLSLDVPKSPGLYEMLVRGGDLFTLMRLPGSPRVFVPDAQELGDGILYILPGNEETHGIPAHPNMRDVGLFREYLDDLQNVIDVVVVDTAPSPGALLTLVYHATDYVVIPAQMEHLSLDGLLSTLKAMSKWDVKLMGIVPTMFRAKTDLHRHHHDLLCTEALARGWAVWQPVHQRTIWGEASAMRKMVWMLKSPGKAKAEAARLINEVERGLHD